MSTHVGSEGIVQVGSNTVAEVRSWNLDTEAEIIEDSELSDTWNSNKTGRKSWSGSLSCWWDETDTNGQEAMTEGAEVTLNLKPEGNTAGDTYFTGSAIIQSVSYNVPDGNSIIEAEFSFVGNGALTRTTV